MKKGTYFILNHKCLPPNDDSSSIENYKYKNINVLLWKFIISRKCSCKMKTWRELLLNISSLRCQVGHYFIPFTSCELVI